jgi:predicted Zn-dependent protease with MMP-like domain
MARWTASGNDGARRTLVGATMFIFCVLVGYGLRFGLRPTPLGYVVFTPLLIGLAFGLAWLVLGKMSRDERRVAEEIRAEERVRAGAFSDWQPPFECSEDEFVDIAERALEAMPAWVIEEVHHRNVAIDVMDEEPGRPFLLGVCRYGRPTEVTLFRLPIIRYARTRDRLETQISETLMHELAHVFGMTDEDLNSYTIGNNPTPDAAPVRRLRLPPPT